jgi:hypothetical protein
VEVGVDGLVATDGVTAAGAEVAACGAVGEITAGAAEETAGCSVAVAEAVGEDEGLVAGAAAVEPVVGLVEAGLACPNTSKAAAEKNSTLVT